MMPGIAPDRRLRRSASGRRWGAPVDAAPVFNGAVAVLLMLAAVTAMHFMIPASDATLPIHLFLRRLYYAPVIYAAWVGGRRGGLLAGAAAAAAFGIHAHVALRDLFGETADSLLEIITFLVVGGLFGTLRDLEEQRARDLRQVSRQLEEAYRKLEERAIQLINVQDYTSSILRSITSAVITVGPDGSVATANPAAERMLDLSELEMVPKPFGSLFREDGGLSDDVRKVLENRVPLAMRETTIRTRSGREIHVQTTTSRMRAVGGAVLGAVVTLEDVSDIRALTEQLIRADRLAAMGELTAGVAHEVRNPLGVIRASVQLLEDAQCDPERIKRSADVIKQEIDRLDKVIKALLDFGRPGTPRMVRVDLGQVIEDVVLFTERFARQSGVTIEFEKETGTPDVLGDPDQLKQVFLNLFTNAVQAMAETGGRIHVSVKGSGEYVSAEVSDTGPGILPEDLPRIFDPFFTKRAEGTGLGLTIVHRIVDEHNGHIEVRSDGSGTTFTVTLPAIVEGQG